MPKQKKSRQQKATGIKQMKLVAIKQECYAISGAATTPELKKQYPSLAKDRDFRRRKTWEYVLKRLREDGEWLGIKVSELEAIADGERRQKNAARKQLVFSPERVAMDRAAENDD
ncbi:MAG: hypothetical protein AAGJ95_09605 [Cyanobacteria bacterium J06554_11]